MMSIRLYICHLQVMIGISIRVTIRVDITSGGASQSDDIRNIDDFRNIGAGRTG